MKQRYAVNFVKFAINIADESIAAGTNFVIFLVKIWVITSSGQRLELPWSITTDFTVSSWSRSVEWAVVRAGAWDIVDLIKIAFGLAVLRPSHALGILFRLDVLKEKVKPLSFFFIQFQTINCLCTAIYLLQLFSTWPIEANHQAFLGAFFLLA